MGTRTRHIVTTAAIGSLFAVAGVAAAAAVDDSSTAVRTTPAARIQYGSADAFEQRWEAPAPALDGSPDAIEHRLA